MSSICPVPFFDTRFLTLYFCRQIKSSLMEVFSIIIPVYNRPEEIDDLLNSLTRQTYVHFEVIVVDDGSSIPCEPVVNAYNDRLRIRYFYIENSGPGLARNQGVRYAEGEIVIVLDSDCIVPASYLEQVHESLMRYKVDAFGGADRAHSSFSAIQKAVNYSMTSFFTTGGIRGSRRHLDAFYPRSFNMGMRKEVYEALGGFSDMRYGEDIDFSIRIFAAGYKCRYFPGAWVYHKRRTNFVQFFRQVWHSGYARIILYQKYPESLKWVHCLPALFVVGLLGVCISAFFVPKVWGLLLFYISLIFFDALVRNKNGIVALLSIIAAFVQLIGYGTGFLEAIWREGILRKKYSDNKYYLYEVCAAHIYCHKLGSKGAGAFLCRYLLSDHFNHRRFYPASVIFFALSPL